MSGRLTLALAVLVLLALSCGGGGKPSPTVTPTLPPLAADPVNALRAYLRDEGVDGKRGDLTPSVDCETSERLTEDGRFCLITDAGHYALALAILFVEERNTENRWEVHLDLDTETSDWKVARVDFLK